ncbi:MAG TPA: TonB-dependent receptor [Candidatus Baltobacteraceae bacterium]|nr:TonB-dependent receptor [Candidatus Baltobacteraceae bacterium]
MFHAIVLGAIGASAALISPSPSPTASAIPQIAHVVTSDRTSESLTKATRVTYVVTHDDIVRNGYRTVADALASVPGVQIASYGPIGQSVSYGIRGSSSSQVLVLVNGLPAAGSLAGTVDLGELSTAGVARVEIVEGGGSTLYGSDSVGGIINVITQGSQEPSSVLRWGSFGDREFAATVAGFTFERTVAANGYPIPNYTAPYLAPSVPHRSNSDYEATTLRYDGIRSFGAVDAELDLGVTHGNVGDPGYYPYVSSTTRDEELDKDGSVTLKTHGKRSTVTLQIGATQQQLPYTCNSAIDTSCFQPSASLTLESRVDAGLRDAVDAGRQQLLYGIDLSRGTVLNNDGGAFVSTVPSATPPPPVSSDALAQTGAYVQDAVDVAPGLRAYAGIRGERDGAVGAALSPSLGFAARVASGLSLKLNYATAFRAPNASELYYPGYGNPLLQPERAQTGDATLSDDRLWGGASLSWFTTRVNDLIVPVLIYADYKNYVYVYQPQNVAHALMQGFTVDLKTPAYRGVSATLNATNLYTAENLTAGTRLTDQPVMTVNLALQIAGAPQGRFGGAGITERIVGPRGAVNQAEPLFFQPAAYANLSAYVDLRATAHADLFLRGYDLGGERYAEITGYPMPGRSAAIELRVH